MQIKILCSVDICEILQTRYLSHRLMKMKLSECTGSSMGFHFTYCDTQQTRQEDIAADRKKVKPTFRRIKTLESFNYFPIPHKTNIKK